MGYSLNNHRDGVTGKELEGRESLQGRGNRLCHYGDKGETTIGFTREGWDRRAKEELREG